MANIGNIIKKGGIITAVVGLLGTAAYAVIKKVAAKDEIRYFEKDDVPVVDAEVVNDD